MFQIHYCNMLKYAIEINSQNKNEQQKYHTTSDNKQTLTKSSRSTINKSSGIKNKTLLFLLKILLR